MKTLFRHIDSIVRVCHNGENFKSGKDMTDLHEVRNGCVLFGEKIEWIGDDHEAEELLASGKLKADLIKDLYGKSLIPGFVDSHTHIVFAGNRSNEFGRRLEGATYLEIAAEGGGILSTVKATRQAEPEELLENAQKIAISAMLHGTTSMEIKSGYGLDFNSELKMLGVIRDLKEKVPLNIKATFLGAHDFPPEYQNRRDEYVDLVCDKMLPAVVEEGLADYCDAFVDKGYYTIEQANKIFNKATTLGLKIRMHADELSNVEAAGLAADIGAVSADHLLFASDENIMKMKNSGTTACLLPGTAYFLGLPYARARKMIDDGVIVTLASDCNPGSCFTENMQFIMSLAAMNMKMTAEESITAATINAAHSLDLSEMKGSIETGKDADFIILDTDNFKDVFYHAGINHVEETWIKGKRI